MSGMPRKGKWTGFARIRRLWAKDSWVRPFLGQYKRALAMSLALGILVFVFAIGLMSCAGYLIGDAAERPELGLFSLLVPLGLVQVFGIGRPFLAYEERLKSHDWVLHVSSSLRAKLYGAVERRGPFWSSTRSVGELLGLLADDIGHVQDLYLRTVFPLACAWALWIVVSIAFGIASPPFALLMLLGLGALCVLMPLVSAIVNGARQARRKQATAELYARVHDDVSGLADWTFAQRGQDFAKRGTGLASEVEAENAALARSSRRMRLVSDLVFCVLSTAVLVWAGLRFGQVAQAPAAAGFAGRPADLVAAFVIGFFPVFEAFAPLPDAAARVSEHAESIERLNALGKAEDTEDEPGSIAPTEQGDPPLSCHAVSFGYPGGRELLHDVSLEIPPGQKLAILGPSGSGKSTLLALMRGDLAPSTGEVTLGGAPASELGEHVSALVGFIQQDIHLFDTTLYENIALGDETISRAQVEAAIRAVGLSSLLDRLPEGLDTRAGETGLRFSGGERHRIALARVLVRDVPIVMLDEPCVGLDPITEQSLLETLFDVFSDRTIVMVTHHLVGIERMDRVVFLENGRIELDGAPAELEATSARYRRLLSLDRGW